MEEPQRPIHINEQNNTVQGDNAKQIIVNGEAYFNVGDMSNEEILSAFQAVGEDIRSWRNAVADKHHIDRKIVDTLLNWVHSEAKQSKDRVCALLGNAGQGKTVVMRDLLSRLEKEQIPTLAIKSDAYVVDNLASLKEEFGLKVEVIDALRQLNSSYPLVVLLIDQIDALSMSLSSNRKPLSTYNRLIKQASCLENVRIVLTCRAFDWEYDSILSNFHSFSNTFHLGDLTLEEVDEALATIKESIYQKPTSLQNFLCNPLHLYLYCDLHGKIDNEDNITLTDLYNKLWTSVIANAQTEGNYKGCLQFISNKMYEQQVLHLPTSYVEDRYSNELTYLTSFNFLNRTEGRRPSVLFIHQSLFDYVYARLYIETGKNIIDDIKSGHQGLFIRARIKQYFQYLRDYDPDRYIAELRAIITDAGIRFHIKHLLVSWLGSFTYPLEGEKQFAKEILLADQKLHNTFVGAVGTAAWFEFVVQAEQLLNRIASGDEKAIAECRQMCNRVGYDSAQSLCVVTFFNQLLDQKTEQATAFVTANFESVRDNSIAELKTLLCKINTKESVIVPYHFLQYHVQYGDSTMVAREIEKYVDKITKDYTSDVGRNFNWSYEVGHLLDGLKKHNPTEALWVTLRCIELLATRTTLEKKDGSPYLTSREFYLYDGGAGYPDESEKWVEYAREELKQRDIQEIDKYMKYLDASRQNIAKVIMADVYCHRANELYGDAMKFFCNLDLLNHAEPLTDYYLIKLGEKLFSLGEEASRRHLIGVIMQINAPSDRYLTRIIPNQPISYSGYTRGRYLNGIGLDQLKKYDKAAAEELRQMLQKHKAAMSNERPYRMTTHTGWPGMSQKSLDTMTDGDMLKAMAGVVTENTFDESRPSMRGYAMQLQQMAKSGYERFKKLLDDAFKHKEIDFLYKYHMLSGLIESTDPYPLPSDISKLYEKLIEDIMYSLPNVSEEYLIYTVRLCDFYTKKKWEMPPKVFNFVCMIAEKFDDSKEQHYSEEDRDLYQSGINQVRGAAADHLVEYCYREDARQRIIEVFNVIAENGNAATVSAMLLKLGYLGYYDSKAMTDIYIKAVRKEFHQAYLHLPIHRLSPVIRALDKEYDMLEPLLRDIVALDKDNEGFAVILWYGWLWGHDSSREMLFELLNKSSLARLSWVNYTNRDIPNDASKEYFAVLNLLMQHLDAELAKAMDMQFDDIDQMLSWENIEQVCNQFVADSSCVAAKNMFLEFLGRKIPDHPLPCLGWLIKLVDYVSANEEQFTLSRLIDLMLNAYNALRKYDKDNAAVEAAMSKFDDILAQDKCSRSLASFLYKLDE